MNITGLTLATNNCTKELVLTNSTDDKMNLDIIDDSGQALGDGDEWCRVSFLANTSASSTSTYYIYYDYASASENGEEIELYYSDFEDETVDAFPSTWTQRDDTALVKDTDPPSWGGSKYVQVYTGSGGNSLQYDYVSFTTQTKNFTIQWSMKKVISKDEDFLQIMESYDDIDNEERYYFRHTDSSWKYYNGVGYADIGTLSTGTWYNLTSVFYDLDSKRYYIDKTDEGTGEGILGSVSDYSYFAPTVMDEGKLYIDDVLITKGVIYQDNPSTYSLGSEEAESASEPTNITLLINGTDADGVGTYGDHFNISAFINVTGLHVELYKNGTLINNGTDSVENTTDTDWFANATYNITAYYPGNDTYSSSSRTKYMRVSKASTTIHLALNGTEGDATYTYNASVNATGWSSLGTLTLKRNGTSVGNPYEAVLAARDYNFTLSMSHQNYSAPQVERFLTIERGSGNNQLTASPSWSVAENTEVTVTAHANVSYTLYRDGVAVSSPYTATLAFGTYNFTSHLADDENYTSATTTKWLTVASGGFGCTDTNTSAFSLQLAGSRLLTLNFTELVSLDHVRADLSDVWINSTNVTIYRNQTGSEYYFVVNASNMTAFTVHFGNYLGGHSYSNTTNSTGLLVNMTPVSGYSETNPYYVLTFLEETTGVQQLPPNSSRTLTLYCSNGASSFTLNDSKILVASFETLTEIKTRISYSPTEIYFRNRIVSSDVEYMNYYLIDANENQVAQMQISISDTTSSFGAGDMVKIKKQLEGTLQTMTEGYLDAESKIIVYLINADKYQVYIDNGDEERNIGYLYVDPTDLTKTIVITSGLSGVNLDASHVGFQLNMTGSTIYFIYVDNASLTNNVTFRVYNYTDGSLLYSASSTNHSMIKFTYIVSDENETYRVLVNIDREGYTKTELGNIFTGAVAAITTVSPAFAEIPSSYLLAASLGLIMVIPMLFGGTMGAAAGVVMVFVAALLAYWGFLSISVFVLVLAGIFAIFNALTKRRVES